LQAIRTDNLGAPDAFRDALDLVDLYTVMIEQHTEVQFSRSPNETDRVRCVKEMLNNLRDKEEAIDVRFARGGHSSIPRSLSRRIEAEIRALGIGDELRPVLTVGPPNNFETQIVDFRSFLFRDLWNASYQSEPRYRSGEFSLISVPYLEGTRASWEPLVVGHEVGHVQVYYLNHGSVDDDQPRPYIDALLDTNGLDHGPTMRHWMQEFLCDLNTYRLYGPAAIAAVAEMLSVTGGRGNLASKDHPPRSTRIKMLARIASLTGDDSSSLFDTVAGAWLGLAEEAVEPDVELPLDLLDIFIVAARNLWDSVCEWGPAYGSVGVAKRDESVGWLRDRLTQGIPGGLAVERKADAQGEFEPADVVNAAWAAEAAKQSSGVPIDDLALKALDNLEFVQLWRQAIERIDAPLVPVETLGVPEDWLSSNGADSSNSDSEPLTLNDATTGLANEVPRIHDTIRHGGILSGTDLLDRLHPTTRTEDRLIATPLLPGAIREAGLDVRLSSSFIVFKHSATEVFDAVSGNQDPREMQEKVEKEWGERFILHPDELVLASTLEYFMLPGDLAAEVASRSSYGRLGLVSVTASKVQPWSTGCITLELVNTSQTPIALRAGERIAQIVFQQIAHPVPTLKPTYRWPTGPEFSRVRGDWDRPIIRNVQEILGGRVPELPAKRTFELERDGFAVLVDVRGLLEFEAGHAPRAIHMPVPVPVPAPGPGPDDRWRELPLDLRVVVISRSGHRARAVAEYLRRRGVDAFVLTGGLQAWRAIGLPVMDVRNSPGVVQ
jgi:deoxycytidine triphosphate deaminase